MAKKTEQDPLDLSEIQEQSSQAEVNSTNYPTTAETAVAPDPVQVPEAAKAAFSDEQWAIINQLLNTARSTGDRGSQNAVSVYGQRDPKSIETVNVKRFGGKFVIGFKDQQTDAFKAAKGRKQYLVYKFDPARKMDNQPFITLLLADGSTNEHGQLIIEEREVAHRDYMEPENRERFDAKVIKLEKKANIKDFGLLGNTPVATEIDDKWKAVKNVGIKQETFQEDFTFWIELPGFKDPVVFTSDPIGPLA